LISTSKSRSFGRKRGKYSLTPQAGSKEGNVDHTKLFNKRNIALIVAVICLSIFLTGFLWANRQSELQPVEHPTNTTVTQAAILDGLFGISPDPNFTETITTCLSDAGY
jgi:hypothetical protein